MNHSRSLVLLGVLAACTKKAPELTRTQLLCAHDWKKESMTTPLPSATGYSSLVLSYADLLLCRKDNSYRFEDKGRYVFDEGSLSCSSSTQTGVGTWQWLNNESQVNISFGGVTVVYDVETLKKNEVKLVEVRAWNGIEHHWRIYAPR